MGTRINILALHTLPNWQNRRVTLDLLNRQTLHQTLALEAYWALVEEREPVTDLCWEICSMLDDRHNRYLSYSGPGALDMHVTPYVLSVSTGGRWSGFQSMPALRQAHLNAFGAIARAFGNDYYHCYADNDWVDDAIWEPTPIVDCLKVLVEQKGQPLKKEPEETDKNPDFQSSPCYHLNA